MELWLLGAGVIVLIAITLLLVWRAPSAEMVGASVRNEEDTRMMPQGDRFEDQYTSATADLSAGGVATTLQSEPSTYTPITEPRSAQLRGAPTQDPVGSTRGQTWPEADTRSEPIEMPARSESFRYPT